MRSYSIAGQQATLSIGSIPTGVYIVKIVYNNKLYTQKALFWLNFDNKGRIKSGKILRIKEGMKDILT